jgi:flavin reductase (DIM6/NTAB) family NADH-FMN oxidoreductase RutF
MNNDSATIPPEAFREAMRLFPAAVSIIAAEKDGVRHGYTATAVSSLSAEPARILTCADKTAGNHRLIVEAERFSVNLLAADQAELASRFAAKPVETRFEHGPWSAGAMGVPVLAGSVAAFQCTLERYLELETHCVFFGRIVACVTEDKPALMYCDRAYGSFRKQGE